MGNKSPDEVKQPISVGLKKKTIRALDEAAAKDGRSRSDYIERMLANTLFQQQQTRTQEIPLRFG